jgi:hypothetical protein
MIRMRHNIMSPGARKRNRAEKASQQSGLARLIVKRIFTPTGDLRPGNMVKFFTGEIISRPSRFRYLTAASRLRNID